MRPFFPYYGSKWNIARHYPAPVQRLVVEPFAGSAGYATFHDCPTVHLVDSDPIIAGIWSYLIGVSAAEILALPEMPEVGDGVDNYPIPQEAKWLIGFWLNRGSASPKKTRTAYSARTDKAQLNWGPRAKERIATQLEGFGDGRSRAGPTRIAPGTRRPGSSTRPTATRVSITATNSATLPASASGVRPEKGSSSSAKGRAPTGSRSGRSVTSSRPRVTPRNPSTSANPPRNRRPHEPHRRPPAIGPSRRGIVLNESLYSSGKSDWETPADLFLALDQEFHFDMDVCAMPSNAKCDRFFTPEQDALSREWAGVVYMNPPYGRQIKVWISKAHTEAVARSVVSVCLVPVRTDTRWWHDHVMQATEIRLMTRRLTFAGATNKAPFPTAIVIFSASDGLGNPRLRKMIV